MGRKNIRKKICLKRAIIFFYDNIYKAREGFSRLRKMVISRKFFSVATQPWCWLIINNFKV